jgi:peroxiredoxin
MKRTLGLIFAGLAAGIGLGVLILAVLQSGGWFGVDLPEISGAAIQSPAIGKQAPDFTLETADGRTLRLSEQRGKPVLINFWATWCGPCVIEMPNIQEYYEKYPGQFEVLAVNADEPEREVQDFAESMNLTFPLLLDPGNKVNSLYRLRGYPTTFILDAEGVVQIQHIGSLSEKQLEEYLSKVGIPR